MKKNVWIMNHHAGDMYFNQGGRHYWFSKFLRQAGYEPVVFCCNAKHGPGGHYYDTELLWEEHIAEEIDTPFVYVNARTYTGNGKQRVLNMIDFYRNVKKAAKEYAKIHGKPDVILASSVHPLTVVAGIKLAKCFGVKCIAEIRDLWPEGIVAYGIAGAKNPVVIALRWLEKWMYKKADALIFTMEGAYDYIIERGWEKDIPRGKVHYINNGVDLELFDYNREHFIIEDEDLDNPDIFKVVYTGSIRRVNNLGLLLDAAKEVTDPRVKFLVWGGGDELSALRQRVVDEGITNVVFKGRVEKRYVPSIVSRADLNFAHNDPSPLFRFGISFNKLFDYLAAGKPVLCDFSCPYNPAIKNDAGSSVEQPSAKNIAEAVMRLTDKEIDTYRAMCLNARKAANEYDFKNLTQKLISILEGA